MVNGLVSMAKFSVNPLMCVVLINLILHLTTATALSSSSGSSSGSSTQSSVSTKQSTSSVKIETDFVGSETKENVEKNDLLKDLKDLGPDDLAKLIKAKKEKDLKEFKSKITATRENREIIDDLRSTQQTKTSTPIVQQTEDDYQSSEDAVTSNNDDFDDEPSSTSGPPVSEKSAGKRPKFGGLSSLFPFLPNPGSVMTMMVKPLDHPDQMVCDCYNPGKTSNQQQIQMPQQQITQQQVWPPASRKVPMMPPLIPMPPIHPMGLFPPSPFAFIGQHFAKTSGSHKKKQMSPLSLLLMGLTGGKRKRPRPRPAYPPSFPNFPSQQPIAPVLPGFEPTEPELLYPTQQIYSIKGIGGGGGGRTKSREGGRKGRKRPRKPNKKLPPPPSSVKGRTKGRKEGSEKGKWHWQTTEDYKDLTQGFNE